MVFVVLRYTFRTKVEWGLTLPFPDVIALANYDVRVQVPKMQIANFFMHLPNAVEVVARLLSSSLLDLSTESSVSRRSGACPPKFQHQMELAP